MWDAESGSRRTIEAGAGGMRDRKQGVRERMKLVDSGQLLEEEKKPTRAGRGGPPGLVEGGSYTAVVVVRAVAEGGGLSYRRSRDLMKPRHMSI